MILLFTLSSCIPTTRVTKEFTQGLRLDPQSKIIMLWDHQEKLPISENLYRSIAPLFEEKGMELIDFHDVDVRWELAAKGVVMNSDSAIQLGLLKKLLGAAYLIKINIESYEEADGLIDFDATPFEGHASFDDFHSSTLMIDIISTTENQIFTRYKSISKISPIGWEDRHGSEWSLNLGNLHSTFYRGLKKAMKRFLKEAYPF